MLEGFKKFILRGNVMELAVAVVIGQAFDGVSKSIVSGVLTPFIGVVAKPDFSTWKIAVRGNEFLIGGVINALINFVLVATAVYFFVVLPMNKLMEKFKKPESPANDKKTCSECIMPISKEARRCPHCTSVLIVEV